MANTFQHNLPGTAHLNKFDSNKTPIALQRPAPSLNAGVASTPWRVILYIGTETITPIRLEVSGTVVIGRGDPADNYAPGVDLSPFGAQDAGVSRRHATFLSSADGLYIQDMDSTNGTNVNGFPIMANQPYKLRDGDRLQLGQMNLTLHIAASPGQ